MDSHTTQNSTSLSAFGSILKDFWEPTSVDVRVILLIEYDKTLYIPVEFETLGVFMCMYMTIMRINKEMDSHIIKIRRAFRLSVPFFWKFFKEPTSVDVRVVFLVEDDKTIYICPYIELETLKARVVCMGMDNVVILSLYQTMTRKQRFR
jgi:hypothetical protein